MLTRITRGLHRRMNRDDSGFTLVEVVVSFVVLAIFASALVVTLLNGLKVSKTARQRVAASNLAAREIEIVRNKFATSGDAALAVAAQASITNENSLSGAGTPSIVDGTPYTVLRTAQWQPTGTGETACDGGSSVSFPALKVSVQVSWPNMGNAKPVHTETAMTPLKGQLDDDALMFIAVKVQNAAGGVSTGVPVALSGPGGAFNGTTDASGCAVFQVNLAGSYSVTLNTAGWVDQTGLQNSVKATPVTVTAGSLGQATMTYDLAASMDVSVGYTAGYLPATPSALVNYTQPNVPLASSRRIVASAGSTTHVTGLWPTSAGYSPWLGGCGDSDPAGIPTAGTRVNPVVMVPGGNGVVTALLAPVDITAKSGTATTATIAGGVVTATSQASPTCATADKVLTLGTTSSTGTLKASLPFGVWKLSIKVGTATAIAATNSTPLQPAKTGATSYTLRTY